MAEWKATISVKADWNLRKEGKITLKQLVENILNKLKSFDDGTDPELCDIICDFEGFIEEDSDDVEDFDRIWNDVYDWADRNRIWIETFKEKYMYCVCGYYNVSEYEIEEEDIVFQDDLRRNNGKKPFIYVQSVNLNLSGKEKEGMIFVCPDCGTLKIDPKTFT